MSLIDKLYDVFWLARPSDDESFYENLSWKTFRTEESIYQHRQKIPDLLDYTRSLQYVYELALEELSNNYLYDTQSILEQFNQAHKERCNLERELAIAQGKIEILEEQLQSARQFQSQSGRKQEIGLDVQADAPERTNKGRFISSDGISTKVKQMILFTCKNEGYPLEQIANELGVRSGSIAPYVSNGKKNLASIVNDNGTNHYIWTNTSYEDEMAYKTLLNRFKPCLKAV